MEFKNVKWSLGGISGRMIKTNEYLGFVADVDTNKNALLISKAPEMLEMLQSFIDDFDNGLIEDFQIPRDRFEKLIKEATELK